MKTPARCEQVPEQVAVIEQTLGDQMHHGMFARAFALQSPGHAKQAAAEHELALESK